MEGNMTYDSETVMTVQMVICSIPQFTDFLDHIRAEGWRWRMYSALMLSNGDMRYTIFVYWGGG